MVQRASSARVLVEGEQVGALDRPGLVVLVGVAATDTSGEAQALAEKVWHLRVFQDDGGRMNRSCAETAAPLLVVSQFTLYGDTSRGRRPSFTAAMGGEEARGLFEDVVNGLRRLGARVATGVFGAHMLLELANDGPVTLLVEVNRRPE